MFKLLNHTETHHPNTLYWARKWLTLNDMLSIGTLLLKGASYINNAGLPDGIALWHGCQIWSDVHVNTCATIYHGQSKFFLQCISSSCYCCSSLNGQTTREEAARSNRIVFFLNLAATSCSILYTQKLISNCKFQTKKQVQV